MLEGLVEGWRQLATILGMVLLLLHSNGASPNYKCGPGLDSPGATIPEGDIVLENGSSLEIFCNLDLNHKDAQGYNASDLVFYRNKKQVDSEFIEVLNATTIRLFKQDPPASKDYYYCKLQIPPKVMGVCLNTVAIGYKPQEVLNFTCVSINWSNLTCKWTKPENPVRTKYTLRFHLPGRAGARMMFNCTHSAKELQLKKTLKPNEDLCFWDQSTDPHYRQPYEYYYFSMIGENQLGQVNFNTIKFHHYSHVIPSPAENLKEHGKTISSVLLEWEVPFPMKNFPPGVIQRVEYQSIWDDRDTWHQANTSELRRHTSRHVYNLTGLKYANTYYDIRVYMRSAVAVGDDKWSIPATLTVPTNPTVPGAAPRTDIGSFEVTGGITRDVYVYWQYIPDYLKNGQNFHYKISVKENGVERTEMESNETTDAYVKFKGITYNSYHFTIVAVNDCGQSEAKSVVYVPSRKEIPPEPISFTKIAFGPGVYELSWKPPPGSEALIESYTIFWCDNVRDRPYQCRGFLNWTHVAKDVFMVNITVPDDKTIYQFAISANTKDASSGMVWASCTVIHNKVVGKMRSVWINRIGSTFIEVGWKLECSDRIGRVMGFHIDYCPIVSPYNLTCKGPQQTAKLDELPTQIHGNITGLKPYTTYMLSIAIMTNNGAGLQSDPLYNTTLEAAPDTPRNVRVSSVTNSSMIVEWLPPASMNGLIRFYKVHYNDSYVQVENNTALQDVNLSVKLENLKSCMVYSIAVSACTIDCSEKSEAILKQTDIGSPGKIERPLVRFINSSLVLVSWKPPSVHGGTLNYYQVAVQQSDGVKNTSIHRYNSTGNESQIPIPDCDTEGFRQKYTFLVRAVNIGQNNQVYHGLWSDPGETSCYSSGPSKAVMVAIWVFGFVVITALCIVFAYAGKRVWLRCKEMQDLEVKLPPGLAPPGEKDKDQDYDIAVSWPSDIHDHHLTGKVRSNTSADEELLLQKKEERHGRNPSGGSSGCSSGHESVSSSLTSGTQISSDSGTEVDQRSPSPDGVFEDTPPWDRTSLRQRNVSTLRPDGDTYVKMGQGSGSVARSTPNLTDVDGTSTNGALSGYSCLGAWPSTGYISMPSSEEIGSTGGGEGSSYCKVGLDTLPMQRTIPPQQQQQPQPAQASPVKGYVILSSMMESSLSNSSPQPQQPGPVPQPQSSGYVSHHLPWVSPVGSPKESPTGSSYVMAGELGDTASNKRMPASLMMMDNEEEDRDILVLEPMEENQTSESYCLFALRPIPTSKGTTDPEQGVSKPSSGYVTLAGSSHPPDVSGAGRGNAETHRPRTVDATGGYVPHRRFEKRDNIPLASDVFPENMDDSYSMVSTSAGGTSVKSPTTNV